MISRKPNLTLSALLFLCVLLLYLPVLDFSFLNFDDNAYITENPFVVTGLSWENIEWAFLHTRVGHWHPLTWISHMLDCSLFGLSPFVPHIENVLIHALNGVLVFLLLNRLFAERWFALVIAGIFAFHPLRIESVAWVSERKDVLSVFFALLTFHGYLSFSQERSWRRYLFVLIPFVLGLLCKPSIVVVPVLLLLLDIWPLRQISNGEGLLSARVLEKLPLLALAFAVSLFALSAQAEGGGIHNIPFSDRMPNVFLSFLAYFGKLFWTGGVGIFYPFQSYPPGVGVGAFFGFAFLSYCFLRRSTPIALRIGYLWFLVSLLPVIGFIPVGGQSFADRWTYLPHLGLLIGVGWWCRERLSSTFLVSSSLIAVVGSFYATSTFLPNWRDSETLFRYTLQLTPNNFMAHSNLGAALLERGERREAFFHFTEAARLNPHYPVALNHLGFMHADRGEYDQAISKFEQAIARDPAFGPARYNLGLAHQRKGELLAAATIWLRQLREVGPDPSTKRQLEIQFTSQFAGSCLNVRRKVRDIEELADFTFEAERTSEELPFRKTALELSKCLTLSSRAHGLRDILNEYGRDEASFQQ
ncbi:MAG: tetratricopeptide repeat protein [Bdellovibrionales bacterium]|nr:tetratricopeptide repeat protein [Bdellovibrionales bacterium]